jgi:16S rRNA (cytosine967-C5)-methyltransferase
LSHVWDLAIESLSWIELRRLNEDAAIRKTVKQLRINDKESVDSARELVYETVRRQNAIDFLIEEALEPERLGELKIGLRSYLRLYTYLVHFSEDSLLQANELVEYASRLFEKRDLKKVRHLPDLIPLMSIPYNEITDTQRLAYKYFHPTWYVSYLYNEFGENMTENLIKPVEYPNYIRVNTIKETSKIDILYDQGFQLVPEQDLINTYRLLDDEGVTKTESYQKGFFIRQDKASILVGEVANPKPNDIVLDVCAAPGIKTSHLAQIMGNTGRIISVDYDERRLKSWKILIDRLGVENAEPVLADASKPYSLPDVEADLVVVDPPCTGTGLLHKSPSSKWRLTPRSIDNMARLQKRILWNSADHLKEGGILVYSTCSITVEENEDVINSLLERAPEYKLVESSPRIGEPGLKGMDEAQRLYPYKHACNGFFIAKLVKGI